MTGFSLLPIAVLALVLARPASGGAGQEAGAVAPAARDAVQEAQASAAAGEERAPELSPIVIDAEKRGEPALVERSFDVPEDVSGFGETIFAEPSWRSFETPAELLGQSVGAQLRRQGGRDDFATLSIRGAPSGQVKILLDGVSLGRASDSVVNLADLPLDTVERIEVYRGFVPVGLSPTSAAGVVNVITRDPKQATASAAVGGGSFGTAKVNVGGAAPLAGGNASAFASARTTDGDFEYLYDNGTPGNDNPFDDYRRKRRNNDSDAVESLLRWRRGLGDSRGLQLRNHVFYKDEGVPGISPEYSKARLETVREIGAAAVGGDGGRWNLEQNVTWESQKLRDSYSIDNTGETTASTTSARWARPLGKSHWFSTSGDYTWEGFDQRFDSSSNRKQEAERSSLAVAAGDDWTIDALATTLSLQLRHQQLWNDNSGGTAGGGKDRAHSTDPRAGLRWRPFGGFTVKANVSTYFRPPTFDEMFGTDGFTTGNPDLRPEDGLAWDAGFEWTAERAWLGKLALGYAYFGSDIDDIIFVILTFDRTAKAINGTSARIRGHEARAEWQGPAGLALSANYTFQDAEDRSSALELRGKELPGLPPHEGWARASWTHGLFVVAYDIDVTGKHFNDRENHDVISTRTVHGLSLVVGPFVEGFRVTLEANNLGDTLVPDEIGFPLPGRSFFATLSWSATPKEQVAGVR